MRYKAIIFDWDGTLSDSTGRIVDSMQCAAADCNLACLADESIKQIIGLGLPEALDRLWPESTPDERQLMTQSYAQYFVSDSKVAMGFYPGALALLDELSNDHLLAVATGKSRRGLNRLLSDNGLQDVFDITRCADETQSKPHPQMLLEILQELDIAIDEAVMVGDTTYDLAMAQAIGMDSVGVVYGAHNASQLQDCDPKIICDSMAQLRQFLLV